MVPELEHGGAAAAAGGRSYWRHHPDALGSILGECDFGTSRQPRRPGGSSQRPGVGHLLTDEKDVALGRIDAAEVDDRSRR